MLAARDLHRRKHGRDAERWDRTTGVVPTDRTRHRDCPGGVARREAVPSRLLMTAFAATIFTAFEHDFGPGAVDRLLDHRLDAGRQLVREQHAHADERQPPVAADRTGSYGRGGDRAERRLVGHVAKVAGNSHERVGTHRCSGTGVFLPAGSMPVRIFSVLGDASIALLITLAYGIYALVLKRGKTLESCMISMGEAAKDISLILLIIAGAGALKQVLTESGTAAHLTALMQGLHIHLILAAWGIAAFIRVCLGSATVAGLTAAGIVAPMMAGTNINPSLIVLATGAGSLMFSHVNDSGFWLFKEYFNLSIRETLKTWSVMESIVSVMGLLMVYVIYFFISH